MKKAIRIVCFLSRRRWHVILCVPLVLVVGTLIAWGCGWSFYSDHSVRFNSYRSGRGFYRLPPLPIMYDAKRNKELTVAEIDEDQYNGEQLPASTPHTDTNLLIRDPAEIWQEVRQNLDQENLTQVKQLLGQYLKVTSLRTIDEEE